MNVKINNLLLVYIAVLFLAIFVSGAIQNITIIFSLVVLNILVYRRLNLNKPIICLLGILLTSIFVIIVYIQYYNAINLGFSDGNLLGKIGRIITPIQKIIMMNPNNLYRYFLVRTLNIG